MAINVFSKARKVAKESGLRGLFSKVFEKIRNPFVQYWYTDHIWEGKIVEWMGNKARIDGLTINVASPYVSTRSKGALWKGIYEEPERNLFRRNFPTDMALMELGASIGVVACMTNRSLSKPDQHIVVEANSHLIPLLQLNRDTNGCQFKIVEAATAYGSETVTFYLDEKFIAGSLEHATDVSITVTARSVQSLAESANLDHFNLICDIEGTEIHMVEHELPYLQAHVCWLLIERHAKIVGADKIKAMDAQLQEAGFDRVDTFRRAACYKNTRLGC